MAPLKNCSMFLGKRDPFQELVLVIKTHEYPLALYLIRALVPERVPVLVQLPELVHFAHPIGRVLGEDDVIWDILCAESISFTFSRPSIIETNLRSSTGEATQAPAPDNSWMSFPP